VSSLLLFIIYIIIIKSIYLGSYKGVLKKKRDEHFKKGETIITDDGFIMEYVASDKDDKVMRG
jgi:hypothetical protein